MADASGISRQYEFLIIRMIVTLGAWWVHVNLECRCASRRKLVGDPGKRQVELAQRNPVEWPSCRGTRYHAHILKEGGSCPEKPWADRAAWTIIARVRRVGASMAVLMV